MPNRSHRKIASVRLPPSHQLLLSEFARLDRKVEPFARLLGDKQFVRELQEQANFSLANFQYPDEFDPPRGSEFSLRPTGAMNPFSWTRGCEHPLCRLRDAMTFSQVFGLYASTIYLSDALTLRFAESASAAASDSLAITNDVMTLDVLAPLIEEGVVRFARPISRDCADCSKRVLGWIDTASAETFGALLSDGRVTIDQTTEEPTLTI